MKNLYLVFVILLLVLNVNAQESKDVKGTTTKMDVFASKTGAIVKFIDYSMPNLKKSLKNSFPIVETRIRKVISGGDVEFFYQISKTGQYDTKTASIAYEDLIEVIKAFSTLKSESVNDISLNPDYLENKFVTADGFELGYYISNGKLVWALVLEQYGSDNTVYVDDTSILESAFNSANQKIEELKR